MKAYSRFLFLTGSCVASVLYAQSAFAQAAANTAEAEVLDTAPGDIIVTAQRRAERARDVPISLTVANAEMLVKAGIATVRDMDLITPGLKIDRHGTYTQPSIRGISTKDGSAGNDSNVAIYIDGVYQPVQAANTFDLPDVQRIEVAKGPQGTLFGRNATGGAIQVFTEVPDYDVRGQLVASYGRFDDRLIKGYANLPLVDGVAAVTIAGFHQTNDGYYNDLLTGGDYGKFKSSLVRGKLLVEPSEGLKFLLTGQYSHRADLGAIAAAPLNGNTSGRNVTGALIPTNPFDIAVNPQFFNFKNANFSFKADADLGFATLTSISAYHHVKISNTTDGDFSSANVLRYIPTNIDKVFSQEVTLTSQGSGPLNWVGGLFYYTDNASVNNTIERNGVPVTLIVGLQKVRAYAAFGEGTLAITDTLTAIAGLRYSRERRILSGHFNTAPDRQIGKVTYDSFTPRFSLRYAVTPDTNVYFTYSQGFKSGGFNGGSLSPVPFKPEKIRAFEIGVKSAPDRTFSINASTFYYDYKDQQVQSVVLQNGAPLGLTTNSASSEIYGAELDAVLRLSPEFRANIGVSVLRARYKKFTAAQVPVPRMVNGVVCRCGNVNATVDASGNALIRAPDHTVSVGLNYTKEVSAGTFDLSSVLYFSDRFFFTPDERVSQPSFATLNARATFEPAGTGVRIGVWGKNLTNSTNIQGTFILPDVDAVEYSPPRTFGVDVTFDF